MNTTTIEMIMAKTIIVFAGSEERSVCLFIIMPSVAYCARELNLSANYLGDLVKKETGKSAQEYIQAKVIDVAKERIFDQTKSVNQIASELGFKYSQHFTRFFKQHAGVTPNEYRTGLN